MGFAAGNTRTATLGSNKPITTAEYWARMRSATGVPYFSFAFGKRSLDKLGMTRWVVSKANGRKVVNYSPVGCKSRGVTEPQRELASTTALSLRFPKAIAAAVRRYSF